ncbi:MAG: hypothetical protein SYC29_08895 [Planctomycetota bacterium]|nr:hypothetical protein [Planctomycetota bacterium]
MQALSADEAEAAWTLQARGVARGLALSEENTPTLIDAYIKSRHVVQEGLEKLREERPPRPARRPGRGAPRGAGDAGEADAPGPPEDDPRAEHVEKRNALLDAQREKLRAELGSVLAGAQLEYAVTVLGTFSNAWDVMVDAVADLELGEEKTFEALRPIEVFVAETAESLRGPRGDRRAGMRSMMEARRKMFDAMRTVLNEEQFAAFEQAVPGRRSSGRDASALIARLDTNGDGVLQRSETPRRMQRLFDRLDANGDGVLDEAELAAATDRGRGDRSGRGSGGRFGGRRGGPGR